MARADKGETRPRVDGRRGDLGRWPVACSFALAALWIALILLGVWCFHGRYCPGFGPDEGAATFFRSHGYRIPFNALWGVTGLAGCPVVATALCVLGLFFLGGLVPRWEATSLFRQELPVLALILLGFFGASYLLRVPYAVNATFGDGPCLPSQIARGEVFAAEVLTCHVFGAMSNVLEAAAGWTDGVAACQGVSLLSGAVFASGVLRLSCALFSRSATRLVAAAALLSGGYAVQFFGYVETTCLELAFMAVYFACGCSALRAVRSRAATWWTAAGVAAFSLCALSHAAGILLAPSLGVLYVLVRLRISRGERRRFDVLTLTAGILLVALPYFLLIIQPFFLRRNWGNMSGGGDGIMFVPLFLKGRFAESPYVSYTLFSKRHLLDVLSAFLAACPAVLLAGFTVHGLLPTGESKPAMSSRQACLLFLGAAAAACLVVPLLWNHDFGMWGDWNLATCFAFPLNVLCWTAFLEEAEKATDWPAVFRRLLFSALVVQWLGMFNVLFFLHGKAPDTSAPTSDKQAIRLRASGTP